MISKELEGKLLVAHKDELQLLKSKMDEAWHKYSHLATIALKTSAAIEKELKARGCS